MSRNNILITGMSGTGKSAALDRLRARGHSCIDMDEPAWSYMDSNGHQHWNLEQLVPMLEDATPGPLFVAGCAEEQAKVYDRFTCVILLSVPESVMIERIQSRHSNSFGKHPEEMVRILSDHRSVEPQLRRRATHVIVTVMPPDKVADEIASIAAQQDGQPDAASRRQFALSVVRSEDKERTHARANRVL